MRVDTGLRGPVQSVNDQGINAESRWRLDRIVSELRTSRDAKLHLEYEHHRGAGERI